MNTFLYKVAEDIYNKFGSNMANVAVVFPNKRAALYLNEYLAQIANTALWAPVMLTISELFSSKSDMQVADQIKLVCQLHKSFTKCTGMDETIDHFYSWGELLLSDFDDIDKNMADANHVFSSLNDIKELDDISYLTTEQRDTLKRFFSNFTDDQESKLKQRFMQLWSNMRNIYDDFRSSLKSQGVAYEGMLYREVAENSNVVYEYDAYVFVGFNVLQAVEQEVFTRIKDMNKAYFYWDFDKYYMSQGNNNQITNEAGFYINKHLADFPNAFSNQDPYIYDNMSKDKDVTYISANTENAQAKYVSSWLQENNRLEDGRKTAIVLCDEKLLPSVIHCIPETKADGQTSKVNITTGYPLVLSPVTSFVGLLMEMYLNGRSSKHNAFVFSYVSRVLAHSCAHLVSEQASELKRNLLENRIFFPTDEDLAINDELGKMFTRADNNTDILTNILDVLGIMALNSKEKDQFFQESLFATHNTLNRLKALIQSGELEINTHTLQRLVMQLLKSVSIPFHGEPVEGLQIMGVLETRNLDFTHLLFLSCNEGNMPKGVNDNSFIPYSVRKAFGLTTIDHKIAVYAYYFHRLLQRAEDVTFIYNSSTETTTKGEMSRFMTQFMVESNHTVNHKVLSSDIKCMAKILPSIDKDKTILDKLSSISYISPTSINRYISCPLKFYYHTVAGYKENIEIDNDDIDGRVFGNIFHLASETIYNSIMVADGTVSAQAIDYVLKNPQNIAIAVDNAFVHEIFGDSNKKKNKIIYNGKQFINREVIIKYIKLVLEHDKTIAPIKILSLEKDFYLNINIYDGQQEKEIKIGGRIDRLDLIHDQDNGMDRIRVIDYKTGRVPEEKIVNVEELFTGEKLKSCHSDYYLQTFLYSCIVSRHNKQSGNLTAISPALLFIQSASDTEYDPTLKIDSEKVLDICNNNLNTKFEELLAELLGEILNPDIPFEPTQDKDRCVFCEFKNLCGRN